jgi:hypothetical protein
MHEKNQVSIEKAPYLWRQLAIEEPQGPLEPYPGLQALISDALPFAKRRIFAFLLLSCTHLQKGEFLRLCFSLALSRIQPSIHPGFFSMQVLSGAVLGVVVACFVPSPSHLPVV